jgi:hypothetical protein
MPRFGSDHSEQQRSISILGCISDEPLNFIYLFVTNSYYVVRNLSLTTHRTITRNRYYHRVIPLSALLGTSVLLVVLLELLDPASQAAASKFCNGFAAGLGFSAETFWRSSNSALSSGSTRRKDY